MSLELIFSKDSMEKKESPDNPWTRMSPEEFDQMLAELQRRDDERKKDGSGLTERTIPTPPDKPAA